MKRKTYTKIASLGVLMCVPAMWMACTDTWNEHFDVQGDAIASKSSLLGNIAGDEKLGNFLKVVEAVGADDMLNSAQQYTVWAPRDLSAAQVDSVIAVYEQDKAAGRKLKDNRAMTQFIQNHISLFSRPISSMTDDTIKMLNNKYMHLVGQNAMSGMLQGRPFNEATITNNGILYKIDAPLTFAPNVREYLEQSANLDSIMQFVKGFDEYILDENSSVAGGVVDGETVYLDSVTYLTNRVLSQYGYIQREDSTYMFIAPTNELWEKQFKQYKSYFTYNQMVPNGDSLSSHLAKEAIICGRFFNISKNNRFNRAPLDSLCNTSYYQYQEHMPRTNVYYSPYQGILAGLTPIDCSNGVVYVDNEGVIPSASTFFTRTETPCYYSSNYIIPKDDKTNKETQSATGMIYEQYDSTNTTLLKRYNYLYVTNTASATGHGEIEFKIPEVMSNVYYNMYLVTAPDMATKLPLWLQAGIRLADEKGSFTNTQGKDIPVEWFENPNPVTPEKYEDYVYMTQNTSNIERCYVGSGTKMDTILLQSAITFPYSSYGSSIDPTVKVTVKSFGPSSSSIREKKYTRRLRLSEIILIPFESEDAAKEKANDLDSFNDDKLQANLEK